CHTRASHSFPTRRSSDLTKDNPDLIWDAKSHDVLAGADIVARGVDRVDLASVIDRVAAVNGFKRLAARAPQAVRILPDDKLHHRSEEHTSELQSLTNLVC